MPADELLQAGQLSDAIDAAIVDVKSAPTDVGKRGFLAELLCLNGELERADKQLNTASVQMSEEALGVALFRQLIRAEQTRREVFDQGRSPEFLHEPTDLQRIALEVLLASREGSATEPFSRSQAAETERVAVAGQHNGEPFEGYRDLDDVLADVIEVHTSTGKYYWVAPGFVEEIEFRAPESPRDLLWRPAQMTVRGGPDGEVYLPAIYHGTYATEDEGLRLGRGTDWTGPEEGPVRGVGQRMVLLGEADLSFLELGHLIFESTDSEGT